MTPATPGLREASTRLRLSTRVDLRTDRPHPARVYDYLLGGKDNFAPDREAARKGLQANPDSRIPPSEAQVSVYGAVARKP